jgi:hypothetical protein
MVLALLLAIRFVLELCLLAAFFWTGYRVAPPGAEVACGAAAAICVALIWGMFLSPRRRVEIGSAGRLLMEIVLFAGASTALMGGGHPWMATLLASAAIADKIALGIVNRRGRRRT